MPETSSVTRNDLDGILPGLWWAIFVLYALVFAISTTVPLGPKLHYPPERIYSEKIVAATTNKDEENVCGLVGASYPTSLNSDTQT